MEELHVIFSGRVQGVGFRYTTRNYASRLGLKGWVRNCADGTVEMVAQGSRPQIDKLISNLKHYFNGNLMDINRHWRPSAREYSDFQITY